MFQRGKTKRTQSAFSLITPVIEGQLQDLVKILDDVGYHVKDNPYIDFDSIKGLHYCSFVVLENVGRQPCLLFEGNIDGSVEEFLAQLVATSGNGLDEIYSHCTGYPPGGSHDQGKMLRYLLDSDVGATTFYVAWRGYSLEDIRNEQALHDRLAVLLDENKNKWNAYSPASIKDALVREITNDPNFSWAREAAPQDFFVRNGEKFLQAAGISIAAGLVATLAAAVIGSRKGLARLSLAGIVLAVGSVVRTLRRHEHQDVQQDRARKPDWETVYAQWSDNLANIAQRENVQGQNHLASVTEVRPGRFRLVLLRTVLWVLNTVAILSANKGELGGINTIHFARWILISEQRRLIFLSNFDGSWERYLNDFIDLASEGLTAVWTNTDNAVGFPKTKFLLWEGARDEQRFKSYARYSQARTQAWYSAYPNLTAERIGVNRLIRNGLFTPVDEAEIKKWLAAI